MAEKSKIAEAVIKYLLIAQMLGAGAFIGFWLWNGKATIPKHGGGWHVLDQVQDPYLYWFLLIAISWAGVVLPLWYLYQGPPKR
ncbi:hypothetical protein [Mesorhizobium salmacidum]|uniref:Uncharacterized protein n=1 Tax=Mesorhizobium salmacidum TaxID=3015171 RepID=A0ABU8L7Z9_9HYPH